MENSSLGAGCRRRSLSRLWLSGIACCSVTVRVAVPQRQCVLQYVLLAELQCVLQCVGVSMCCSVCLSRLRFSGIACCSVTVRVAVPQRQCVLQYVLQSRSACCTFPSRLLPPGTAFCIWSVISSISNRNRCSSSVGLVCHVSLKRDQGD